MSCRLRLRRALWLIHIVILSALPAAVAAQQYYGAPYRMYWAGGTIDAGTYPSFETAAAAWWQLEIVDAGWDYPGGCHWELHDVSALGAMVRGVGPIGGCEDEVLVESWGRIHATSYDSDDRNLGDPGCCGAGNPVNVANGNKYQRELDFDAGGYLRVERHYNSQESANSGSFGKHWNSNFDARLTRLFSPDPSAPAALMALRPDGHSVMFKRLGNAWTPASDVADRLMEDRDGNGVTVGWRYRLGATGAQETYSADGVLTGLVDPNGFRTQLRYAYLTQSDIQ